VSQQAYGDAGPSLTRSRCVKSGLISRRSGLCRVLGWRCGVAWESYLGQDTMRRRRLEVGGLSLVASGRVGGRGYFAAAAILLCFGCRTHSAAFSGLPHA
jgi:hypothetical protein